MFQKIILVLVIPLIAMAALLPGSYSRASEVLTPITPPEPTPAPVTKTLTAIADSFVTNFAPRINFGRSPVLLAGKRPESISYLKFDLRNYSSASISAAKLRVYSILPHGNSSVRNVPNDSWTEYGITYQNKPGDDADPVATMNNSMGWVEVDITAYAKSQAGQFASVDIKTNDRKNVIIFSRETKNQPQIVLTVNP